MPNANYKGKMFITYLDSDRAWELIEKKTMGYDVDMDDLYPEHFQTDKTALNYQKVMDKLMMEGEEYQLLKDKCDGYAITSFARVINVKHINQVLVYISKHNAQTSVRNVKIHFATEFAKYGWSFNINDIKRRYDENKWDYRQPTRSDI